MVTDTTESATLHGVGAPAHPIGAELYVEVLTFYAKQMRLLDALRIEDYAATFTEDAVIDHVHRSERAEGRAAMLAGMRAALPRYQGVVVRHWLDHILVEPGDNGACQVSYCSLVTRTDATGTVAFEPTFAIEDVLVRQDSVLRTKSRTIHRDTPAEVGPGASS